MGKRKVILLAAILIAAAGLTHRAHFVGASEKKAESVVSAPSSGLTSTSPAPKKIEEKPSPKLPDLLGNAASQPTTERMRAEVALNPHTTPAVMLDFAAQMSTFMTIALSSDEVSEQAARQLEQCVVSDGVDWIDSARALCLVNLERLAKADPILEKDVQSTRDQADARVALIARAMGVFGK